MSVFPGYLLDIGALPYDPAHALQLALVAARQRDEIPDTLLLVEHEPVITLGRRGDQGHVLASAEVLAQEGIAVRRIERGGDVTYHGPGQVVAYPIVHLPSHGLGASDYMHCLEQALIDTLAEFGLETRRREGLIGVWIGENKIAALGVRIRRGVTFHGLALNVAPDMRHWAFVIPCGITDSGVTSMALELERAPSLAAVRARLAARLALLLRLDLHAVRLADLELSDIAEDAPC